jgi:CheY-like chemotaxis protein
MPVWDGVKATKEIRSWEKEHKRQAPVFILAITADAVQEAQERYLTHGMDCYLAKPLDLHTVR